MYTAKVNVHYVGYTAGIVPLDWSITGHWSEWTPALCAQSGTSPALRTPKCTRGGKCTHRLGATWPSRKISEISEISEISTYVTDTCRLHRRFSATRLEHYRTLVRMDPRFLRPEWHFTGTHVRYDAVRQPDCSRFHTLVYSQSNYVAPGDHWRFMHAIC